MTNYRPFSRKFYQAKKTTTATASFNNGSYVKGKINIWQEIDWLYKRRIPMNCDSHLQSD